MFLKSEKNVKYVFSKTSCLERSQKIIVGSLLYDTFLLGK